MKKAWLMIWKMFRISRGTDPVDQRNKTPRPYCYFFANLLILAFCLAILTADILITSHQDTQTVQEVVGMICTYLAAATDEEYSGITQSIRNDLIESGYGEDIDMIIRFIPNTAEKCYLELDDTQERIFLVLMNTGETFCLDLLGDSENASSQESKNRTLIGSGYDGVSGAHVMAVRIPEIGSGYAKVENGSGTLSVLRMKTLFCDDCIRKVLEAIDGEPIKEMVLYDKKKKEFFPITEGNLQIGDCKLQTTYTDEGFKIEMSMGEGK